MTAQQTSCGFDSPIPSWLPDETFFSLCSRYHVLSGRTYARQTAMALFDHRTGGTHHDFPNRLDDFAQRTEEAVGSADQIAGGRTLLRFYAPFLPESDIAYAIEAMRSPSVAHLKYHLGLVTSRFRAHHPLKACPECIRTDVKVHGWAYWHLCHQFPGVWMCLEHRRPLAVSTRKSTGVGRFQWHLPTAADLTVDWTHNNSHAAPELLRFSQMVVQCVEQHRQDGPINMQWVLAPLRARLFDLGWITSAGSLKLTLVAADYLRFTEPLRCVPELISLPCTIDQAAVQLGRLLRAPRGRAHPLRILLAVAWLFRDFGEFDGVRQVVGATVHSDHGAPIEGSTAVAISSSNSRCALLLDLLAQGYSVSAAAGAADIDVATAIAWAARAGMSTPRRPKVIKPALRARLVVQLRQGADKSQLASSEGVSIQAITRLLRSEVGLGASWHSARHAAAKCSARATWRELLSARGVLGIKLMRAEEPAVYAWLYRNDRAWLQTHSPPKSPPAVRRSSVQWDERDSDLSARVQHAAAVIAHDVRDKPLRLWQLYQAIPELKAKLAQLDRLPLTRRAIDQALCRRSTATAQLPLQR